MENLSGLVELTLLNPPTFPALTDELKRADAAGQPYHVVHFDGHGVYSRQEGFGSLCFEHPQDLGRYDEARTEIHRAIACKEFFGYSSTTSKPPTAIQTLLQ